MKVSFLKKQYYLYIFLILFSFLGDILNRVSIHYNFEFIRYTTLSKVIFIIIAIFFLIYFYKEIIITKEKKKIIAIVIALIFIFFVGRLILNKHDNNLLIYNNIFYLGKYLFFPFLLLLFLDLQNSKEYIEKLFRVFEIVFFINIAAILFGFLFDIEVFETYYLHEKRFGYKGIYSMSGQTSIMFILMGFYYMHHLIFKKFNNLIFVKLLIVLIFSLMLGTKRIFFILPLIIAYYLFFLNGFKKKITYKTLLILLFIVFLFKERIITHISNTLIYYNSIYSNYGFLSFFTSYRNELLFDIIGERYSSILNYIFGGLDFSKGNSQMGFIDLQLFFGPIGILLYLYLYRIILKFKFSHHFYYFTLFSLILIVFFADAFILDTNVPILFFLLSSYFYLYETKKCSE